MNNNKIIQSVLMLLPAVVVGVACALGLGLHPVDIVAPDNTAAVSQISDEASEISSVSETAEPETVSEEQHSLPEASNTSKTEKKESNRTSSSKSESKSSVASKEESSKVQEMPKQQSSQRSENSRSSNNENKQASVISVPQDQTSKQQESSRTAARNTSSPQSRTEVSKSQTAQTSQKSREQSKTEVSHVTEIGRQESRQAFSKPLQESSTVPTEVSEVIEETSYTPEHVPEEPDGRYTDGTYKATAKVDGFDEEGFLYDLEVTVTVSGGEITSITGKIKNDRSEDPSSNEAYVRRAVKKLSYVIIANQGTDGVDVISNATYSSNAVLRAVSEALSQAER